jgi:hypothetical protein
MAVILSPAATTSEIAEPRGSLQAVIDLGWIKCERGQLEARVVYRRAGDQLR